MAAIQARRSLAGHSRDRVCRPLLVAGQLHRLLVPLAAFGFVAKHVSLGAQNVVASALRRMLRVGQAFAEARSRSTSMMSLT